MAARSVSTPDFMTSSVEIGLVSVALAEKAEQMTAEARDNGNPRIMEPVLRAIRRASVQLAALANAADDEAA